MGRICKKDIRIDFERAILFGSYLCNVNCPRRFPTVTFTLIPTEGLAERVWVDGYVHTPEERMSYEYTVGLNGYLPSRVDSVIEVRCLGLWIFSIALDDKEQKTVYKALDSQCRERLGYSCEELLKQDVKMLDEVCKKTGKNKSEVISSSLLLLYYKMIHSELEQ